jgi:multidrug efflux pump subunit AcrA (membrane-fusion protein)
MQESPQRTENQLVDHPHVQVDMGFFDEEGSPVPIGTASPQQGRGRRGWIAAITILLLVIILGALAFAFLRPNAAPRATYQDQTVVQGNLQLTVSATGPIQGTTYNADFLVTGKISEIDVSVGQHVKAGQTLAKLDTSTLPSNTNQSDAVLTAPHDGTVTSINGAVGASSSIGNSNTHFIQIVDTSSLQIVAAVNETDIGKVAVNNTAQFSINAYGNQQFAGTVSAIAPQGQTVSNVVTYPVTINVDMNSIKGLNVLPSMTANVTITTQSRSNVLLIPVSAVNFAQAAASQGNVTQSQVANALTQARQKLIDLQNTGSDAQDSPSPAFVLAPQNGQLIAVPVVLGLSDGTVYEVLSGLSEGQTIATSSATNSVPGQNAPAAPSGGNGAG